MSSQTRGKQGLQLSVLLKFLTKLISILLTVAMTVEMTYVSAWAEPVDMSDADKATSESAVSGAIVENDESEVCESADEEDKPFIVGEDESLRTETEKQYRLSDGSYMVAQYAIPIHYIDAEEKYQDIDNTLVETTRGYEPKEAVLNIVLVTVK